MYKVTCDRCQKEYYFPDHVTHEDGCAICKECKSDLEGQ